MKEALSAVVRRPRVLIEQFVAYILLGYLGYLWLALPVGRMWQIAVLLLTALLWFGALFFTARRAVIMFRRDVPRLPMGQIVLFGALLAGVGLLGAWALINWVPALDSLTSQVISFAARFGLAYLVILACWLTFAAMLAAGGAGRDGGSGGHAVMN
jgi:hypothetical protein